VAIEQVASEVVAVLVVQTSSGQKIVVTEKALGSLGDRLRDAEAGIPRHTVKNIFLDILAGKQEMDDRNIIHVSFLLVREHTSAGQTELLHLT